LNIEVIRRLLAQCKGHDVVVPVLRGELQPLHAIYSKRCMGYVQERIAKGDLRIYDFFPKVSTLRLEESVWEEVDPENRSFSNINTKEALMGARAEMRFQGGSDR